ncbi:DUF58 domain-containing protein [bacterium]|nr:DUF58 domain-containing protein [bacterium]MCI0604699.1 DUF58 domain-containing protein [bacterium]
MQSAIKLRLPRMPIAVEFTREGVIFMLLSLAIGAAAVNTGNNVLYLIFSLMLGMIVVSGMASRRILQGLHPTLQFPDHLFAGVQSLCYISVSNRKKKLPSLAIRFAVRDPKFTSISRHFFYIPAQNHASGYARFLFSRRGVFTLKEMELQTQFPFSFFLKIRRYFLEQPVRVYPHLYRFSEDILSRFSEGILRESPYRGDSQQLLHLRDYNSFDSSKKIHWKASAKAEKLLVKEYQREQGRDLYLYFDSFPDKPRDPVFETAISFLASLAFLFREQEIDARIVLPGKVFDTAISIIPLLSYLAEWDGKDYSSEKLELPGSPETLVLQLRSRRFPSRLGLVSSGARNLYVEDWQHLMRQDSIIEI